MLNREIQSKAYLHRRLFHSCTLLRPAAQLTTAALALCFGLVTGCTSGSAGNGSPGTGEDGSATSKTDMGAKRDMASPQTSSTRFAELQRWSVSQNGLAGGFHAPTVADGRYWETFDLDGDGRPDLVSTNDTTKGSLIWDSAGSPYWKVYLNNGSGFNAVTKWLVPRSGLDDGFYVKAAAIGYRHWSTFDINGDGRPDLVLTGDTTKAQQVWDAAGSPYWKVFLNNGKGFDPAINWLVPKAGLDDGFYDANVSNSYHYWRMLDINGDGKPDLLHTGDTTKIQQVWDAAGSPYWKVYLNTGSGFAGAMNWPIPSNGLYEGFYSTDVSVGSRYWSTLDIDGDGKPDLIQTADSTKGQQVWDTAGSPYWKVFLNIGTGFGPPINWSVPQSGLYYGFYGTSASTSTQYWSTIDITGDGKPDLVQTGDSTKMQQVWDATGSPYWKIFPNTGKGFGSVVNWQAPSSGLYDGFFATAAGVASRFWGTFDINGDGRPDLVQTTDSNATAQVWDVNGTPYWKVFLGMP